MVTILVNGLGVKSVPNNVPSNEQTNRPIEKSSSTLSNKQIIKTRSEPINKPIVKSRRGASSDPRFEPTLNLSGLFQCFFLSLLKNKPSLLFIPKKVGVG